MTPGATAVTRMFNRWERGARDRTKPLMPCFAALYIGACIGVTWPAMLETWTMDFGEFSVLVLESDRKCEIANWVVRIGWVRLISTFAYRSHRGLSLDWLCPGGYQKLE